MVLGVGVGGEGEMGVVGRGVDGGGFRGVSGRAVDGGDQTFSLPWRRGLELAWDLMVDLRSGHDDFLSSGA